MNGQGYGDISEANGMTPPKPWPHDEKANRDGAAEQINDASVIIDGIVGNALNLHLPTEAVVKLYTAQRYILDALRLLERAGAPTLPKER